MAGTEIRGRFFDGKSAVARPVTVTCAGEMLEIRDDAGTVLGIWPLSATSQAGGPIDSGEVRLTTAGQPGARLVVAEADDVGVLKALAPHLTGRRKRHGPVYWSILTAAAAVVIGGIVLAIDRLPVWAAPLVPREWEAWVGDRVVTSLAAHGGFCNGAAGKAALDELGRRLSQAAELDPPANVRVIDWKITNAFAVPGAQITVLRGLIDDAATPEELAGVLAHEIGHVVHHHPTEGLLRQLGLSATLQLLVGGSGTGIEDAAGMGNTLLALSYGRDAEREADATAVELLAKAGIDGRGLHDFFERMRAAEGSGSFMPEFFSTHPATADRLAATGKAAAGGPAMTAEQWQALRKICD